MPPEDDVRRIFHLGWRANGDGLDVALAVNRLLAGGERAWWLTRKAPGAEAGDYLVETSLARQAVLARAGVTLARWDRTVPDDASPITRPIVRLFAGKASKYPYFAYYALCLLRLGIDYVPCDGASLARDALDNANLLILPGGFATWGIDAAEDAPGADARVRAFLQGGGAAIGSCGGAFYLSAGRPGWTGTANAKPLYTHEYLQSGVGIVTIALREGPLAYGCPPTMEVPYYHGPIYDALADGIDVAATFHSFALPGRLAIDNPLDRERFEREMKGRPAVLIADGERGRAVLFSPHPEMGDLLRKYIALDGYVRHYLPIRGEETMRDTLRHYRVTDAPSFRLVLNAVHALMADPRAAHEAETGSDETGARSRTGSRRRAEHRSDALRPRPPPSADTLQTVDSLPALRRALDTLPDPGAHGEGDLLRDVASRIDARLVRIVPRTTAIRCAAQELDRSHATWTHLAQAITGYGSGERAALAQRLMDVDLGVSLVECWTRVAELDDALACA